MQQKSNAFRSFILFAALATLVNVLYGVVSALVIVGIIYFFLAAAGIVPPQDVVPFVPFI